MEENLKKITPITRKQKRDPASIRNRKRENKLTGYLGVEIQKPHTKMKLRLDTGERKKPTKEFYTFP